MQWYDRAIFPLLCDCAMRAERLNAFRSRVAGAAHGRVLELGIGSGLNLPFYQLERVRSIIGLEPSHALAAKAQARAAANGIPLHIVHGCADAIPLADESADSVVCTWTLCSVPALAPVLAEIQRVLAPHGKFFFTEHGLAPEAPVQFWQRALTPLWKRCAGGCHLDRPISQAINNAGFFFERLESAYIRGPKPLTFMYEGVATR
jgi:SAM-dependent methyltransferase